MQLSTTVIYFILRTTRCVSYTDINYKTQIMFNQPCWLSVSRLLKEHRNRQMKIHGIDILCFFVSQYTVILLVVLIKVKKQITARHLLFTRLKRTMLCINAHIRGTLLSKLTMKSKSLSREGKRYQNWTFDQGTIFGTLQKREELLKQGNFKKPKSIADVNHNIEFISLVFWILSFSLKAHRLKPREPWGWYA